MKTFFMTLLLLSSFSSLAESPSKTMKNMKESTPETQVLPKAAPGASVDAIRETEPETRAPAVQQQQTTPGVENDFKTGPYDTKDEYIFFDRLEMEQREAQEELEEQNQ